MINSDIRISAVIPAFNEVGRIGSTVRAVIPYVDEIIVIDDASLDKTSIEAEAAGAKVIKKNQNEGYISAIKTGFQSARGFVVVTIDADGEFPPDKIPDLVKPVLDGKADMVQGHRNEIPRFSERVLNWIANLKCNVGDTGTGFRAIRTSLARQLELNGACICGIFSLEAVSHNSRLMEVPVYLQSVQKPRRIAWYHLRQFVYLLPWLFRGYPTPKR